MKDSPAVNLSDWLPRRPGPRPRTRCQEGTAHAQLSQNPPVELQEKLFEWGRALPGVFTGKSIVSVPGARALFLDETLAIGPEGAFQAGTEFAHIHPAYDGSLHLTLPAPMIREVEEKGWGERHPVSPSVMVYGPRDEFEMEVVWWLLRASYRFAVGDTAEHQEG
jgi:phospholipase/carboxylesterase